MIFSGTLRSNLDPLQRFSDHDLWTAIERAHLKDFVNSCVGNLQYECGEGGQNFRCDINIFYTGLFSILVIFVLLHLQKKSNGGEYFPEFSNMLKYIYCIQEIVSLLFLPISLYLLTVVFIIGRISKVFELFLFNTFLSD